MKKITQVMPKAVRSLKIAQRSAPVNTRRKAELSFAIVPHVSAGYKSMMAGLLARRRHLKIKQVTNKIVAERGCVYLIPPDKNVTIAHGKLYCQNRNEKQSAHELKMSATENGAVDINRETAVYVEQLEEELTYTQEHLQRMTDLLKTSNGELKATITEVLAANDELQKRNEEIKKQNADLQTAKVALEQKVAEVYQAYKFRSEFLASISHELRTPMNNILLSSQLLNEQFKKHGGVNKEMTYIDHITENSKTLHLLISDILDESKIESGKMELSVKTIDIAQVVDSIKKAFHDTASLKQIKFQIIVKENTPHQIVTDLQRLQQILANLLSNSFKFTNNGGIVKVICGMQKAENNDLLVQKDDLFMIAVQDNGIGITEKQQKNIFQPYMQTGGIAKKNAGTGLGLFISFRLAQLLGGNITLKSQASKGSTFTVTIPVHPVLKNVQNAKYGIAI